MKDATEANQSFEENSVTAADSKAPTIDDAIAYLDNKDGVWQRDSLIKYPELDGLFEELNSYEFSKIINRDPKLRNSKNFKKIYDAIRLNIGKPFSGSFCGDDDFSYSITVSKYEKKLKKPVDQPKAPDNGGVASDAAKKAQESANNTSTNQNTNKEQKNKRGGV